MSREPSLFPVLQPPDGGLTRLRTRLRSEEGRARRGKVFWAVATAAIAAVLAIPASERLQRRAAVHHWVRAIEDAPQLALAAGEPVSAVPGDPRPPALLRVTVANRSVILYAVLDPLEADNSTRSVEGCMVGAAGGMPNGELEGGVLETDSLDDFPGGEAL